MADIQLPDDIIFPEPQNTKEEDLFKTLQDNHRAIVDSFSALEDIENQEAGDGLTNTDNTFSVNVDDTTVEINGSGNIQVKDDGISGSKLAPAVAGSGLVQDGSGNLDINVDNSTVEVSTDTLQVKALGIDTAQLAADSVDDTKIVTGAVTNDGLNKSAVNSQTDAVITASDEILFSDASDSNNLKKDTVQGILDLTTANEHGSWASRSFNTNYQSATDGYVTAYAYAAQADPGVNYINLIGKTDSATTPTTIRMANSSPVNLPNDVYVGVCFPVKSGDYYRVDQTGGTPDSSAMYWIPQS